MTFPLERVFHVPHLCQSNLGVAFLPVELKSSSTEFVTVELVHLPFGSSLSAVLACFQWRHLSAIHFHSPYYSFLALDRITAFSASYIVPKASHPAVASNARFGRKLLEEQEVMSDYQSALQPQMRLSCRTQIIGREGETATFFSRRLFNSELREFGFAPRQLNRYAFFSLLQSLGGTRNANSQEWHSR